MIDLDRVLKFCSYHLYTDDVQIYTTFDLGTLSESIERVKDDL